MNMKARLRRWALRVWGAFSLLAVGVCALFMIAATLFSNMDRIWAVDICLAILFAAVVGERKMWRAYFVDDADDDADAAETENDADVDADEPEPDVIVRAPMTDEAAVISSEALASLTGDKKEQVWL